MSNIRMPWHHFKAAVQEKLGVDHTWEHKMMHLDWMNGYPPEKTADELRFVVRKQKEARVKERMSMSPLALARKWGKEGKTENGVIMPDGTIKRMPI